MMANLSMYNPSGCPDPTAHDALLPMVEADEELQRRTNALIKAMKIMVDLSGYDLLARIEERDRQTGKVFR